MATRVLPALTLAMIAASPVVGSDVVPVADGWAFRVLMPITAPKLTDPWIRNDVDTFVLAKLQTAKLRPGPEADRRTILRRLSLDLTGLPPTTEELDAFLKDTATNAYDKQVDRLLATPRYGERWARHWLDVAHYADSHGHDEDAHRVHAWPYRDWLIRAFNDDKHYAKFVSEQIAGDVLRPHDSAAVIATGFLAAGPWDQSGLKGVREDSLDRQIAYSLDRDDIVSSTFSAFTGLTIGCARCHDHKFDPITQDDYYAAQAVFAGVDKTDRPYDKDPALSRKRAALKAELASVKSATEPALLNAERQSEVKAFQAAWLAVEQRWILPKVLSQQSQQGATLKPLPDQSILSTGTRPDKDTYTVNLGTDRGKLTGLRLEALCDDSLPGRGPGRCDNGNLHLNEIRIFARAAGHAGAGTRVTIKNAIADFNQDHWVITQALDGNATTAWGIHPAVGQPHRALFEFEAPVGFDGGTELTVELDQIHGSGHLLGRFRLAVTTTPFGDDTKPLPAAIETLLAAKRTSAQQAELTRFVVERRLTGEIAALPAPSLLYGPRPIAPRPVHVLKRGEITRPGAIATPGAIVAVSALKSRFDVADEGQRRMALAKWIVDLENPLTWRVIVNRVWHYHFGRGIVDTPNDFGKMGGTPSHPELLDWLAVEFREHGSLKKLHRLIVTSATYRQAVRHDAASVLIDADNRLLWRMNRGRFDAESVRDAMLLAGGKLDLAMYGPSVKHFNQKTGIHAAPEADYDAFDVESGRRRSVYRFIFRTRPDPLLAALDCPDASQSAPVRSNSVGALQALALWNNKLTLKCAEDVAANGDVSSVSQRILGREPNATELKDWTVHAEKHGLAALARVLFNSSEFLFIE